jgi:16S rRNA (cytosine967-C5)-methyltransferase
VLRRLTAQVRRFPDLDITPIDSEGLDPRDAGFAHALDAAITRRWLTLTGLINLATRRPFDELELKVRAALLAGTAQLLFMDKVPPRAALFESVEWVKANVRPGAGAIVNAVLHRMLELRSPAGVGAGDPEPVRRPEWTERRDELPMPDGSALVLAEEVLPADPMQRLSVATSVPVETLRVLSRWAPMRDVKRVALQALCEAPVILNTAHATAPLPNVVDEHGRRGRIGTPAPTDAPEADPAPGELRAVTVRPSEPDVAMPFTLTSHRSPGHHVFRGPHQALVRLLGSRADIWAQDPASSNAVRSVADLRPEVVLDVCAGKGTKTRQLAATFKDATIVATDVDNERRRTLREAFAGDRRVEVIDPPDLERWIGKADLVLVDAPCSNTGVMARRIEARYRASDDSIRKLADLQRQILADSMRLLREGGRGARRGRILYATCSLDERENDEIAAWAERWHALGASRRVLTLPSGGAGAPDEQWNDGAFSVLLG